MPVALETSKRKFHRLLDSFTGNSPSSTSNSGPEPSSKRTRLTPSTRRVIGNTGSIAHPSKGNNGSTLATSLSSTREAPNYTPWSHEFFLARLKTFSDLRSWTFKPPAINEVAWAKRGWTLDRGVNRVACKGGCEERLVVSLRPRRKNEHGEEIPDSEDLEADVPEELVARYEALIVDGHGPSCLWRLDGCKDDIYRLPIARPRVWQPSLKERYRQFDKRNNLLPSLDRIDHQLNLKEASHHLGTEFFAADAPSQQPSQSNESRDPNSIASSTSESINQTALAFALLGWHAHTDPPNSTGYLTATCGACFRRLGLWMYTRPATHEVDNEDATTRLDLHGSHRDYCPWINAVSQDMPGSFASLAAWEILQRVIANWSTLKARAARVDGEVEAPITSADAPDGRQVDRETLAANGEPVAPSPAKSREEVDREDKARFARLHELTRSMGLRGLRGKLGRDKAVGEI